MVLAIVLPARLVAAEVYRWVDETGAVQFGDRPPAIGAERVEVSPASKKPQGLRPQEKAMLERVDRRERFDKREARLDRQQLASERRAKERRVRSCERSRRDVEVIQAQLRDGYTAERGARLEQKMDFAREDVRRYCR
jgi:hypothetical protein